MQERLNLGFGFNNLNQQQVGNLMDDSSLTPKNILINHVPETNFHNSVIENVSDLRRKLTSSVNVSFPTAYIDASLGFDYSDFKHTSNYDLFYYIQLRCVTRKETLLNYEINKEKIERLNGELSTFFSAYGDSFINEIAYGFELLAIIHFKTHSLDQQKQLASNLSLQPLLQTTSKESAGVKLKTEYEKELLEKNIEYSISLTAKGVKLPIPGHIGKLTELDKIINEFANQANIAIKNQSKPSESKDHGSASQLYFNAKSYSVADFGKILLQNLAFLPSRVVMEAARDILDKIAECRDVVRRYRDYFDYNSASEAEMTRHNFNIDNVDAEDEKNEKNWWEKCLEIQKTLSDFVEKLNCLERKTKIYAYDSNNPRQSKLTKYSNELNDIIEKLNKFHKVLHYAGIRLIAKFRPNDFFKVKPNKSADYRYKTTSFELKIPPGTDSLLFNVTKDSKAAICFQENKDGRISMKSTTQRVYQIFKHTEIYPNLCSDRNDGCDIFQGREERNLLKFNKLTNNEPVLFKIECRDPPKLTIRIFSKKLLIAVSRITPASRLVELAEDPPLAASPKLNVSQPISAATPMFFVVRQPSPVNAAQKLLSAMEDKDILGQQAENPYYWYSLDDGYRLLIAIRNNTLHYTNRCNLGEEYSSYRENTERRFIMDPVWINHFATAWIDDIKTLTANHAEVARNHKCWQAMPTLLIVPFLAGSHWRAIRIEVNYEKRQVGILWDDPFGGKAFSEQLKATLLPSLRKGLDLLLQRECKEDDLFLEDKQIIQHTKSIDQQGAGENSADCGPIIFRNVQDYSSAKGNAEFSSEDTSCFTVNAAKEARHAESIQAIRREDATVYNNIQGVPTSKEANQRLETNKKQIVSCHQSNLEGALSSSEVQSIIDKISAENWEAARISAFFNLIDNKRALAGKQLDLAYTAQELSEMYEFIKPDITISPHNKI